MARLRSECIGCLLRHHINAAPEEAPEEMKREYLQKLLGILADASKDISTPLLIEEIVQMRKDYFPLNNEYAEIKKYFNNLMMEYEAEVGEKIKSSDDPLKAALQFSMVGNFIDFGAMDSIDENKLHELLMTYNEVAVDQEELRKLKAQLEKAKRLVLLADNCGEIVMDKLLLRELRREYPEISLCCMVRGEPVINDATMEDAIQVGITDEFKVVGNGSGICGTVPERLSPEAKKIFDNADIILSKGQGNFEALHHCEKNVYYAFLCKCRMFAEMFGVEQFSGILASEEKVQREIFL